MKKILAILLALTMIVGLSAVAFASDENHTITITNTDSSVQHTYEAYQVFAGNLDASEGILSDIVWGSGVNGAALLTALKADATIGTDFVDAETAADVAKVIENYENDSAKIDAFATLVGGNLTNTVAGTSTQTASPYTITGLDDGYYFVKDKDDSVTAGTETYSKYMLQVVKDVSVEAKDDQLTPEKTTSVTTVSIGDVVPYKVTLPVPKMNGYSTYTMVMTDTMDKGLAFDAATGIESVKVGSKTLTKVDSFDPVPDPTTVYTVTAEKDNTTGNTTVTVTFYDFIQYKGETGNIEVKYNATITEEAFIGTNDGIKNDVSFTHSNNPYKEGSTGETPHSTVTVYTTEITIHKVDGATKSPLAGAEFKIEGDTLTNMLSTGVKYEKLPYELKEGETVADAGPFYLLNDGKYTKTAPTDATAGQYASREDKYEMVSYTKLVTEDGGTVVYSGITGTDGLLTFTGLSAGTYTITELTAPDGYNLLEEPIEITIEFKMTDDTPPVPQFSVAGESNLITVSDDGTIEITIENNSGSTLPSTGGIGTTIFYIVGGLLAVGAGVVLVTKKRMSKEDV